MIVHFLDSRLCPDTIADTIDCKYRPYDFAIFWFQRELNNYICDKINNIFDNRIL